VDKQIKNMKLDEFDYNLPENLVASHPITARSCSKLMLVDSTSNPKQTIEFYNIINHLSKGDLLVLNDTKVIPARLFATKPSGGNVEILISEFISSTEALAMLKTNHKVKPPITLKIKNSDVTIECIGKQENNFILKTDGNITDIMHKYGSMPLPPYMKRATNTLDNERYQTVYAKNPGAIAAPTAGLHFDQNLLSKLTAKGIKLAYVTLHVGSGTFTPVKTENIHEHVMHYEYVEVSEDTAEIINNTKSNGHKVYAVGTTSIRSLESAFLNGKVAPFSGKTNLFITPGYKFKIIDGLITNFHLPKSTLLMLTCALGGYSNIMGCYKQAIKENYRFYSYGDAMFIKPSAAK
jgi:S-adenosylmethionine:tRNA ribosyltransferase-isomerase